MFTRAFTPTFTFTFSLLSLSLAVMPACSRQPERPQHSTKTTATSKPEAGAPTSQPVATKTSARNPCELITKQEVEEALGAPVADPRRRGNTCDFLPQGKRLSSVSFAVRWTGGRDAMRQAGFADTLVASFGDKSVRDEMKKMAQRTAADLEGLGDEASFQLVTLHVRKGDAYVTIDARLCSRAQAIAVARKVVSRL